MTFARRAFAALCALALTACALRLSRLCPGQRGFRKGVLQQTFQAVGLTETANSFTPEIPAPALHAFTSEHRETLGIPSGTMFYEESTYWKPSWTIAGGAIETTNIYDLEAGAAGIGSGKLSTRDSYQKMVSPDLLPTPSAPPK